ncbi:MAG: DUF1735 domain-containing protein [Flavisolibacter sp.]
MKQSKIYLFFLSAFLISQTSCLKERDMNIDASKGTANVIEFENTGDNVAGSTSKYPRFTSDLGSVGSGETVKFNVNVSYSGAEAAPEDITVTLGVDPDLLAQYNSENGTNYVVPPSDIYSLPTSVVIKKGQHQATVEVGITNNNSFDFNVNYGLPLKIVSATTGTISNNFGKAVYSFSARNSYDGLYLMEATAPMVDVTSPSLTGWYPIEMQLITYTGNSVALYDGINYVNAYGHPIISGGTSGSYYGTFSPVFYFDATGKITSVGNYYGQNAGGNKRSAVIDPTGVNQATFNADGSIKSFEVSYIMTQSVSSPDQPRTYFHEKFTYEGPR